MASRKPAIFTLVAVWDGLVECPLGSSTDREKIEGLAREIGALGEAECFVLCTEKEHRRFKRMMTRKQKDHEDADRRLKEFVSR